MTVEAKAPPDERGRIVWAVIWMGGSLVSFTVMAIAGRAASRGVDPLQIAVWRATIGLAILIGIVLMQGARFGDLRSNYPRTQLVRNLIQFAAMFSWLYALTRMPLAELTAIEFTAPVWVALLAPFLIGERLSAIRLVTAALGFAGVLIVLRPGAIPLSEGTPYAITAAIGFALTMITTKRLLRGDSAFTILFWMQGFQIAIGLAIAFGGYVTGLGQGLVVPDATTFGWLVLLGVLGLTAHYSLAKAFSYADTIVVAPMDFLRLPLTATVGLLIYAEPLDPWVLAGGIIVVFANLLNIVGERRAKSP